MKRLENNLTATTFCLCTWLLQVPLRGQQKYHIELGKSKLNIGQPGHPRAKGSLDTEWNWTLCSGESLNESS